MYSPANPVFDRQTNSMRMPSIEHVYVQGVQQSVPTPTLYVVCLVLKCGTTTASNPRAAAVSLAVCSQRGAIRRVGQHVQGAVSPPHGGTLKYIVWTLFL